MDKNKKVDLRVAIISDIHIGFAGHLCENYYGLGQIGDQGKWWEYALRYFKARGVDVVVVPGDMSNATDYETPCMSGELAKEEMKRCGRIFREVFEGTDTQLVCIYGNHDAFAKPFEKACGGEETPWQDAFLEEYSPVVCKCVKGYFFVGAHWGEEQKAKGITARAARRTPDKPVFYIQHAPIKNTTYDSYNAGVSGELGLENVKDFENVIALFGHTHRPITDERTIWQSVAETAPKCTAISCASFNYAHEDILVQGENLMTKHALYLTVQGKEVNIERLSFYTEEMIALAKGEKTEQTVGACTRSAGADWNFTIGGEKVFDFEKRKRLSVAPEFSENAVVGTVRGENFIEVAFPAAITPKVASNLRGYYIEAWEKGKFSPTSTARILTESHIDDTAAYFSPHYHAVLHGLSANTEYVVKVYAQDTFGNLSHAPLVRVVERR